jgi:stage V sporulation protein S
MTSEGRAPIEVLKAAATSKPVSVAGAIAGVIRSQSRVEIHAIGAGAVNQAIKAIAISRGYLAPAGLDLVCIPSFVDLSLDGQERRVCRGDVAPVYPYASAMGVSLTGVCGAQLLK